MTPGAAAVPTWVTSGALGLPIRGGSPWAALWASWRVACPWPGSVSMPSGLPGTSGRADRRRGGATANLPIGRPNRKRRQYLRRRAAANRRRARDRGFPDGIPRRWH